MAPRRVFIYPADGYLGRRVGQACSNQGFEVLGGCLTSTVPDCVSTSFQVGSHSEAATQRQFLATADVVIYEMHGFERAARDAVVHMAKQPFGGRQQLFLGVSTPLVWAATRPAPPEEEVDVPDSASDLVDNPGAAHTQMPATPLSAQDAGSRLGSADRMSRSSSVKAQRPADPYSIAASLGVLTDRDAWRRAPCLRAREVHELEQLVVRCQRKGKLRTAVVCPGMLYGAGEADDMLHQLMRTAWELQEPLKIYGPGSNFLPTMQVDDFASYLTALCGAALPPPGTAPLLLAGLPDTLQYLLAADCPSPGHAGGVQQADLVTAIAQKLGTGETLSIPSEDLLFTSNTEQWTLNTPMACTPLPDAAGYAPHYSEGILSHLDTVVQQWRDERHVNPLRVVVSGPPMSGKSAAAARLATLYKLPLYDAKTLLASADKLSPDDAKALQAELSGKEPRASSKSMAALLRAVLASNKTAINRGYVLDAVVKTAGQAKWAFMKTAPMSAEEISEKEKDEQASRATSPAKGAKGAPPPAAKKDAKGKAGGGGGDDGPPVPDGQKLVADPDFAPTHLIELSGSVEELYGRRAAMEARELEAVRAATPPEAAGKGAKGGKDKAPANASHNNEKDYARRQGVWAQIKADEQADLEAQVSAAQSRWERQQAEREAERLRLEAEARTLRARRRKAREEAAAAAAASAQGAVSPDPAGSTMPAPATTATLAPCSLTDTADSGQLGQSTGGVADAAGAPAEAQQPVLPQYGGLPGALVGICGTQYLQVVNTDQEGGPPVTPESWEGGEGAAPLSQLQSELTDGLGPARNFEGLGLASAVATQEPGAETGGAAGASKEEASAGMAGTKLGGSGTWQAQMQEAAHQAQRSLEANHAHVAEPVKRYIMAHVMPTVTDALRVMSADRPEDPVRFLAQHLLAAAEKIESQYVDPYTDPSYEMQRLKHVEKRARDEARALAAELKAEKELAAKAAAKQAAAGTAALDQLTDTSVLIDTTPMAE